jgi:hypothetical protein
MKVHIFALSAVAIALAIPNSFAQTTALEKTALNTDPAPMRANYSLSAGGLVSRPPAPRATTQIYRPFSALDSPHEWA